MMAEACTSPSPRDRPLFEDIAAQTAPDVRPAAYKAGLRHGQLPARQLGTATVEAGMATTQC